MQDYFGMDFTFMDLGVSDHHMLYDYDTLTRDFGAPSKPKPKPVVEDPTFRHDGTSPLPLGIEWSLPPSSWNGRQTVWPHDTHTGWRYCVTIPSWTTMSNSRGTGPVVYYRVQVGIQTPEEVTTTRLILRRFSEFMNLFSELQKLFPKKVLPAPPPRKLLGAQSRILVEKRRSALEAWLDKLLSNIGVSRSAPVAIFLELEAAVRSSFNDSSGTSISSFVEYEPTSKISAIGDASSVASDYADSGGYEKSDIGTPEQAESHEISSGDAFFDENGKDIVYKGEESNVTANASRRSTDSAGNESYVTAGDISCMGTPRAQSEVAPNFSVGAEGLIDESLQSLSNLLVALPSDQRQKFSKVLVTLQRRLATRKADMEDLVARLNQEIAVRQYLTTKITDLEMELETTKESTKDNVEKALLVDKEKYTQMQWDVDELQKKCLEMEMKLKAEQEEKMLLLSENSAVIEENEMLRQDLEESRNQLNNLQKNQEESETKAKTDLKVLVKEVKSLRNSQSSLQEELSNLTKEKLELERDVQNEKQKKEDANAVNHKLLHECSILRKRLDESSVNFRVEDEDKLILDTSSEDAIDLLVTSDNRVGLLLAEAQLLAQEVDNSEDVSGGAVAELRKMVTELFIGNATARKQINSLIRCALKTLDESNKEDEGEEMPPRQAVLGNLL